MKDLQLKFQDHHELNLSTECLREHGDGLVDTLKYVRRKPKRTVKKNVIRRIEYRQMLFNYQADGIPIINMNETNFNLFISRKHGRWSRETLRYITA